MRLQADKKIVTGSLLALGGAALFSTKAIFVKSLYSGTPADPLTLLALRMLFAAPFYILILLLQPHPRLRREDWLWMGVLGVSGYYISLLLDFEGLQYVSASLERLLLYLYPSFVLLIAWACFGKRISKQQRIAVALCYAGIAAATMGEAATFHITGALLILGSAILYAVYIAGSERLIPRTGTLHFTAYTILFATIAVAIHWQVVPSPAGWYQHSEIFWQSGFMALFSTVIPSLLTAEAVKRAGAGHTAIVSGAGPVCTMLLSAVFLGEAITWEGMAGTGLVITGIWMISRPLREVN